MLRRRRIWVSWRKKQLPNNSDENELKANEEEDFGEFLGKLSKQRTAPVWLGWHWHSATGNLATGILASKALGNRHLATGKLGKNWNIYQA